MKQNDIQNPAQTFSTMTTPSVPFTLDPAALDGSFKPTAPLHGSETAAGFDLYAASSVHLMPGASKLVSTGVRMAIPEGWFGMICPRSSVAYKTPLRIGARIIDSDYRGEVMINIHNDGNTPWGIDVGERIAQIVFMQHLSEMVQVESLEETNRGDGGFGSTGL